MEQKTQGEMAKLCRRFQSNGGTSAKAISFLRKRKGTMLGICTVNTTLEWIIEKTSRRRDEDICGSKGKPMLMEKRLQDGGMEVETGRKVVV